MEIYIQKLEDTKINGVTCCFKKDVTPYTESYFDWKAYPMISNMKETHLRIGLLTSWHHKPEFDQIEYHDGQELFFFTEGPCLMLFCDIRDGAPIMESAQLVRIEAGTELLVDAGKGHFVPVGVDDTDRFRAVVVSPPQEAPRIMLPEIIIGV